MNGDKTASPAADVRQDAEQILQCAHCGVHVPASEAVISAGVVFCSQEHRLRHGKS